MSHPVNPVAPVPSKPCRSVGHGGFVAGCHLCKLALTDEASARAWGERWPPLFPVGVTPESLAVTPTASPSVALPPRLWPWWARLLRALRSRRDAGAGDTFERLARPLGGGLYKRAYQTLRGRPCPCASRRARWNADYPYDWYEILM